jgi:hypothetical protein
MRRTPIIIAVLALKVFISVSADIRPHSLAIPRLSKSRTSAHHQLETSHPVDAIWKLRGGDQAALISKASDWVGSLSGPASMISGAVLSNLYQTMRTDAELSVKYGDATYIKVLKKMTKFLLTSAFAMVISCIFFSLITRSMLLALPPNVVSKIRINDSSTPMSVLQEHFEFEYLTCQILMGQGLINWLAAIALTFGIPSPSQTVTVRKMNVFISTVVTCMILVMVSFFNNHLIHYANYPHMLVRWLHIMWRRFIWHWPLLPMTYMIGPVFCLAVYQGIDAFFFKLEDEDGPLTIFGKDVFG